MQISLPVKYGGFGIRSLNVLALPAFLSSYYGALNIMNKISPPSMKDEPYNEAIAAEDFWKKLPGMTDSDYPLNPNVQKQWDTPICKLLLKNLRDNVTSSSDLARLNAITQVHSSD